MDNENKNILSVDECVSMIVEATKKDSYHFDKPQHQIDTLDLIVNNLVNSNPNGENDLAIGFFTCVGRSLTRLIKLEKLQQEG